MDEGRCTHVAAVPISERGLIVEWRCRCGKNVERVERDVDRAAACVCGHLRGEHAPQWCGALACDCRAFRATEGAS